MTESLLEIRNQQAKLSRPSRTVTWLLAEMERLQVVLDGLESWLIDETDFAAQPPSAWGQGCAVGALRKLHQLKEEHGL